MRQVLPKSARAAVRSESADTWSAGASVRVPLVRVDGAGVVDLFDPLTLQRSAGFDLGSLTGADQPSWYSTVQPSPDGRHLLGYVKLNYRDAEPVLSVFDTQGRRVLAGSPYEYDRFFSSAALAWLPDGRIVYLAGPFVVVAGLDGKHVALGQLPLPSNVSARGAVIHPSPDGEQLLLELSTTLKTSSGIEVAHTLLYVSRLDGSQFRALTALSEADRNSLLDFHHVRSSWSPDGRTVAFGIGSVAAATQTNVGWLSSTCSPIVRLPATAESRVVDRNDLPGTFSLPAGAGGAVLETCKTFGMAWMSSS